MEKWDLIFSPHTSDEKKTIYRAVQEERALAPGIERNFSPLSKCSLGAKGVYLSGKGGGTIARAC